MLFEIFAIEPSCAQTISATTLPMLFSKSLYLKTHTNCTNGLKHLDNPFAKDPLNRNIYLDIHRGF